MFGHFSTLCLKRLRSIGVFWCEHEHQHCNISGQFWMWYLTWLNLSNCFFLFWSSTLFILATDIWARNVSFMKSDIVPTLFIQSCFRETILSLEVPPKNFRSFRANFPLGLKWIQWNNKKIVKSRWKLMLITHPYPFPILSKCLGLESPCFLGMPKMLWFEALENGAINFENSWLRRTNS